MRLCLDGQTFQIKQMGPDFLFVEFPVDHPPARATIEMEVDDSHDTWEVNLPCGMQARVERVVIGCVQEPSIGRSEGPDDLPLGDSAQKPASHAPSCRGENSAR